MQLSALKGCLPFAFRMIEYLRLEISHKNYGVSPWFSEDYWKINHATKSIVHRLPELWQAWCFFIIRHKMVYGSGQCTPLRFDRAQSAAPAGPNSGPMESPRPSFLVVNTLLGLAAELSSTAGNWE